MEKSAITTNIKRFKKSLRDDKPESTVRDFLVTGDCMCYEASAYNNLKSEVAEELNVHPNDVVIVGSGKLGFSLVDKMWRNPINGRHENLKKYRHFDVNRGSDIDIAVCNLRLFDDYWNLSHELYCAKYTWDQNDLNYFRKKVFDGWIRPDLLPATLKEKRDWFNFFEKLSSREEYKKYPLKCGLYRDWRFLERYQVKTVTLLHREEQINKIKNTR